MRAALVQDLPIGDILFEPKWDGFRALAFVDADRVHLQSRHGRSLASYFPDVTRLLRSWVPVGTVLDGELIIWDSRRGRTSFPALQRRLSAGRRLLAQARALPAHYVVFDVLATAKHGEVLDWPLTHRRELLEAVLDGGPAQLQLCPQTRDVAEARTWMREWEHAGVEGLVGKRAGGLYTPGRAGWSKLKVRHSVEAIVGGVTGAPSQPQVLLLGRYDERGRLQYLGQTLPMPAGRRAELGPLLSRFVAQGRGAAVPHPWPQPLPASWSPQFTDRRPLPYVAVQPTVVVEVDSDTAIDEFEVGRHGAGDDAGSDGFVVVRWRHRPTFLRARTDLSVYDVAQAAAGF